MSDQRGLRILSALFFLSLIIISWQEIKLSASPIGWPRPQRFIGITVVFALLGFFADIASAELAAVIGAGLTMGLIINVVQNPVQNAASGIGGGASSGSTSTTGPTGSIQV